MRRREGGQSFVDRRSRWDFANHSVELKIVPGGPRRGTKRLGGDDTTRGEMKR